MDEKTPPDVDDTFQSVLPALLGFTAAAILAAFACLCTKRYQAKRNKKSNSTLDYPFKPTSKPRAVRSPNGQPPHYLKKSPSPTAISKPLPGSLQTLSDQAPHIPHIVKYAEENEIKNKNEIKETNSPTTEVAEPNNESSDKDVSEHGKLGTLVFKLRYLTEGNAFVVSIVRCRGLPGKSTGNAKNDAITDRAQAATDPYVKLQLLPEKQHKVKTRVVRSTRNPVYDEDFTFYGLNLADLSSMSLHFVVLSFDRYSRDDVIGEVVCPLSSFDLVQIENQQVAVSKEIQPRSLKIRTQGRGELLVSLCWQPAASRLTVVLLKARNLPRMDVTGLADPYVKIYLLYNGQRIAKKKTHVKKRTLSPVFNESFAFDIPTTDGTSLEGVSLELMLLDWDRVTKNEVIGKLELGGPKCTGTALNHWNEVCNSPRRQIAEWHKLNE